MVFVNEEWNNTGDIVVYSNYHKYWLDKERNIKNPLFDVYSGRILDLKEGKPQAIRYFYNLLDAGVIKDYKKPIVDYLIIPMDGVDEFTFNIYNQYLNENKKVEICMLDKNFKQKMKYANRLNVPYVIIVGENEKNNNEYVLKNMYDGSQKIIKL